MPFLTKGWITWIVRLVIVGLIVYMLYAFCQWLIHIGEQECSNKVITRQVTELVKTQKKVAELIAENARNKLEYEGKLAANDIRYEKEKKDAETIYQTELTRIRNGTIKLHVPIKEGSCFAATQGGTGVSNIAPNTSGVAGTSYAELQADFSEEVFGDYARADALAIRYNKALEELKQDRLRCKGDIREYYPSN